MQCEHRIREDCVAIENMALGPLDLNGMRVKTMIFSSLREARGTI